MITGILSRVLGGRRGAGTRGTGRRRGMGGGRTQDEAIGRGVRSLFRRGR